MPQKYKSRSKKLKGDLINLYDDLTQFSDQCSFLCDAFAAIPAQDEIIDSATIGGISFYSQWIKIRILEIKLDLKNINEQVE